MDSRVPLSRNCEGGPQVPAGAALRTRVLMLSIHGEFAHRKSMCVQITGVRRGSFVRVTKRQWGSQFGGCHVEPSRFGIHVRGSPRRGSTNTCVGDPVLRSAEASFDAGYRPLVRSLHFDAKDFFSECTHSGREWRAARLHYASPPTRSMRTRFLSGTRGEARGCWEEAPKEAGAC